MTKQKEHLERYIKYVVFLILMILLHEVYAQTSPPQLDSSQLEKALITIELFELSRYEIILKELLNRKSSPNHYLYNLYLGRIHLRTALYYESKSKGNKGLLETSEYLINQARDQFKKVVRENGDFSDGYVYLAMAYAQKIKYVGYPTLLRYAKRVDKNIKKALAKNPNNPRAYLVQGIQAMYKPPDHGGGVDKAIPLLLKSVKLDPAFHEGYYWLARAYVQNSFKGRDEGKSKEYLSKALKLSPDDYFYQQGLTPDVQIPEYKEGKKNSKK
jgi:tetratricopeptide (TPR) repeat protein